MDFDATDLKKLLELNQKGLIADEVLAKVLNERYLKNDVIVEKKEEEKREELAQENRERANRIREEQRIKQEEYEKEKIRNQELINQDKRIEDMKDFLENYRNSNGEIVYSKSIIESLEYFDLLKLYEEKLEDMKNYLRSLKDRNGVPYYSERDMEIYNNPEFMEILREDYQENISINSKDYFDQLVEISKVKEKGTLRLSIAKDKDGKFVYLVYQNKYNLIGFDRIDPETFENLAVAQEKFDERVKKEEEILEIYDVEEPVKEEPIIEEPLKQDEVVLDSINNSSDAKGNITFIPSSETPVEPEAENNSKGKIVFTPAEEMSEPEVAHKEPVNESIGDLNSFSMEDDAPDEELGDLNKKAETLMNPEIDTKFEEVQASPERMEKLKKSKNTAKSIARKSLIVIATAVIGLATGGLIGAGIMPVAGVIAYNSFAKKIRNGSWNPTSEEGKFLKYEVEKIMNLGMPKERTI